MNANQTGRGRLLAILGALFQLGPVIGSIGAHAAVGRAIATIKISDTLVGPSRVGQDADWWIMASTVGSAFSIVGLFLIAISLLSFKYRGEWIFWFLLVYGVVLLFGRPVGTAIGVALLVFVLTKRNEFLSSSTSTNT